MISFLARILNVLLDPTIYLCLGIAIIILRLRSKKSLKIPVVLLLIYFIIVTSPLVYWPISTFENTYKKESTNDAEAIMVLGGGATHFDLKTQQYLVLSPVFSRPLEAILLAKKLNKRLIISGGDPKTFSLELLSEAKTIEKMAIESGVNPSSIFVGPDSLNTFLEAQNIKPYLVANHLKKIILVTSALHMPRSVKVFKKQGIEIIPYPVDYILNSNHNFFKFTFHNIGYWRQTLHEVVGLIFYSLMEYT